MKVIVLLILIAICSATFVVAQPSLPGSYKAKAINPIKIDISVEMTTNLIFPFPIKSVDRGSGDILAQKARGAENVLQVKAAREQFKPSNLTVITADGQFFSFLVNYALYPSFLNLSFYRDSVEAPVHLAGTDVTIDIMEQTAKRVSGEDYFMGLRTRQQRMKLRLGSIHYLQGHLWLCLDIRNTSFVDYDVEYLKFFVRDRKRARRTAVQQKEITSTYNTAFDKVTSVHPGKVAIALPAFTLSGKQELRVLLKEKNGGRDLELVIRHGTLLRARQL